MQNEPPSPSASGDIKLGSAGNADQLGPDQVPVIRPQVPAAHSPIGSPLKRSSKLRGARPKAVADVLEVAASGASTERNCIAVGGLQAGEVGFEGVHTVITSNGAVRVNTIRCSSKESTRRMDEEARQRVDRLIAWCKSRRIALAEDGRTVSPKLFTDHAESIELTGGYSYWASVFSKSHKSFSQRKAREVEAQMRMPRFHLDGGEKAEPPTISIGDGEFHGVLDHPAGDGDDPVRGGVPDRVGHQVRHHPGQARWVGGRRRRAVGIPLFAKADT